MLLTTLPVGSDSVLASYGGSADFLASVVHQRRDRRGEQGIDDASGSSRSANPSALGQPMTFTATVFPTTGSGETGVVTFYRRRTRIGTSSVSNGQATLNVFTLPAGDHPITADYAGDGDFIGSSTPAPLTQVGGPDLTD